jgi:hypothetical protein
MFSGCSVARLSRLLWEQEAAGSNPATPTNLFKSNGGIAQLDRASRFLIGTFRSLVIRLRIYGGIAQLDRAPAF